VADEDTVSQPAPKDRECPAGLNLVLGELASEPLEKDGKQILAVDTTEAPGGEKDMWVHRFVGLSVVGEKRCVPLSLKPVPFGVFPADLVLWALGEAERLGLRVDALLLDPGLPQRGGSSSSRGWAHPSSSEPGKPGGSSAC